MGRGPEFNPGNGKPLEGCQNGRDNPIYGFKTNSWDLGMEAGW